MMKMLAYYGSKISNHMTKTPEGFLICHNVPIARIGKQDYLESEIGLTGDKIVSVNRDEDEVFSQRAIASFEGKPVTYEHPPCAVGPENYGMYMKGHAQNVHRGKGKDSDLLIADLFINDDELIRQIDKGLREISCGYECEYEQDSAGKYHQCKIRGNHIAVVEEGRAGSRVSIKDSLPHKKGKERNEIMKKPSVIAQFFSGWAMDKSPEEVATAIDELIQPAEEEAPVEEAVPETDANEELIGVLKQILEKLGAADEAPEQDPIEQLVDELTTGNEEELPMEEDEEESVTVPVDEIEEAPEEEQDACGCQKDSAATIAALRAIKPFLANLPASQRRAAADAATKAVRRARGMTSRPTDDGYAKVVNSHRKTVKQEPVDDSEIGRAIMEKYNPHYKNK